ncbi:MAG: DUF1566 domain-containing protein [Thioploca sp.]|nr:DUF1566 domain-containing protein [Thioploca sp.]
MWLVNHYPKLILSLMFLAKPLLAGPIDSPAPPDDIKSAMYRVEDICQRLKSGEEGELKAFSGPESGPQENSRRCTLNDVMAVAPKKDEMSGAQSNQVLSGKTYWGLRAEQWGKQTGTMADQGAPTYMPSTKDQVIAEGYHNGEGKVQGDEDLTANNILKGIELFGVIGNYECPPLVACPPKATGTAVVSEVLAGKTFSTSQGVDLVGTMPNQGEKNYTPKTTDQPLVAGYYNGSGVVTGDANLVSDNIKAGITIFGVSGNKNVVDTSSGDASSSYILEGQKAWVDGKEITGKFSLQNLVNTSSGDAVASEIITGKKAWVDGVEVTGTRQLAPVPRTGQTTSYVTGDDGNIRKGVTTSGPRFTDPGNGTVTDNLTGLIWLKEANCFGQQDWTTAIASANNLSSGSCSLNDGSKKGDWRLPNTNELFSLIDRGQSNPVLPSGHPFLNVQLDNYWSATTYASNASNAWVVALSSGSVNSYDRAYTYYVWPVRGGQ